MTVTVKADKGSLIYGVEMRMCRAGAAITNDGDWLPTVTGQCASKGLSPGADGYKIVPSEGDRTQVTATYKVGTGTDTYMMDDGTKNSVTCDAAHPCEPRGQVPDPQRVRLPDLSPDVLLKERSPMTANTPTETSRRTRTGRSRAIGVPIAACVLAAVGLLSTVQTNAGATTASDGQGDDGDAERRSTPPPR